MITLGKALRLFTDQINAREKINIQFYETRLTPEDYKRFVELSDFISLLKSKSAGESFLRVISKVDNHKCKNWDIASASAFRADSCSDRESAKDRLDQIFNEEHQDE